MPGRSARIGKRVVEDAKPQERGDLFVRDTDLKGFGLRVTAKGTKSYFVEYRMGGRGTPKGRMVIGKHGSPWTPDTARVKAAELLRSVKEGRDPGVLKRQRTTVAVDLAFQRCAESFVDLYAKRHQKRSWRQAEGALAKNVTPKLKDRPLPDIRRGEITKLIEEIAARKPATARYVFAILRKLFRWAVDRGDIERSPIENMRGPAIVPSRDRVLRSDELGACWREAEAMAYPFGPFVQLLIATGQRRAEVLGMDFSEIDMEKATWTIPASRSKNKAGHVVPLNTWALSILKMLTADARMRGLVFTTTGRTPVSGIAKYKARLDLAVTDRLRAEAVQAGRDPDDVKVEHWRLHDIRRTVATGLQQLGVRFEVTEAILNHLSGARSGVAGVYQRYNWDTEKRAALEAWSRKLDEVLAGEPTHGSNVVQLSGR